MVYLDLPHIWCGPHPPYASGPSVPADMTEDERIDLSRAVLAEAENWDDDPETLAEWMGPTWIETFVEGILYKRRPVEDSFNADLIGVGDRCVLDVVAEVLTGTRHAGTPVDFYWSHPDGTEIALGRVVTDADVLGSLARVVAKSKWGSRPGGRVRFSAPGLAPAEGG